MRKLILLAALVITAGSHFALVRIGPALVDSDFAWIALEADRIIRGEWRPFYYGELYGGTFLTAIRALWVALETALRGGAGYLHAQMIFSYLLCPLAVTISAWFCAFRWLQTRGAIVMSIIAAVGFEAWTLRYGHDFYILSLIGAFLLLGARGKRENPIQELSFRQLIWSGLFSGFLLYNSRLSIFSVLAFWCPTTPHFWSRVRAILIPQDRLESIVATIMAVLLGSFLYLEIFGAELGTWHGHVLRVHSRPNLDYALILGVILFIRRYGRYFGSPLGKRIALLLSGAGVGFSPEIFWRLTGPTPTYGGDTNGIPAMVRMMGRLPDKLRELLTGTTEPSLLGNATLLLVIWAGFALWRAATNQKHLRPLILMVIGSGLGFLRTKFHYEEGPYRYLFPLFPPILIAIGVLVDQLRGRFAIALLGLVSVFHLAGQGLARTELIARIDASRKLEDLREVGDIFGAHGIELVLSDEYWRANAFTLASERRVRFFAHPLAPKETWDAWEKRPQTLGVLLKDGGRPPEHFTVDQVAYSLSPLGQVGELSLYRGTQLH